MKILVRTRAFTPAWKMWIGIYAVAVTVLIAWFTRPNRSSVEYHLRCLEALRPGPFERPERWQEWFSWKAVQWLSHGGQSMRRFMVSLRKHQQALIAAGYYETRWVSVEDHGLDARYWNKLYPGLTNTIIAKTRYTMSFDGRRPHAVRLTARRSEIDEFERKLHLLESQAEKEQAR